MAIWHFELALLPAESKPSQLTNHGWMGQPLDRKSVTLLRPFIGVILGREAAYTSCTDPRSPAVGSVLSFGRGDGNRIDLVDRGEEGIEAWAAIDARSDADAFCAFLCQVTDFWDCELLSLEQQMRLKPDYRVLKEALMNSRSWIYALNPTLFDHAPHR